MTARCDLREGVRIGIFPVTIVLPGPTLMVLGRGVPHSAPLEVPRAVIQAVIQPSFVSARAEPPIVRKVPISLVVPVLALRVAAPHRFARRRGVRARSPLSTVVAPTSPREGRGRRQGGGGGAALEAAREGSEAAAARADGAWAAPAAARAGRAAPRAATPPRRCCAGTCPCRGSGRRRCMASGLRRDTTAGRCPPCPTAHWLRSLRRRSCSIRGPAAGKSSRCLTPISSGSLMSKNLHSR